LVQGRRLFALRAESLGRFVAAHFADGLSGAKTIKKILLDRLPWQIVSKPFYPAGWIALGRLMPIPYNFANGELSGGLKGHDDEIAWCDHVDKLIKLYGPIGKRPWFLAGIGCGYEWKYRFFGAGAFKTAELPSRDEFSGLERPGFHLTIFAEADQPTTHLRVP
jgi:hypothetical protein